ncbi:MAG: GNAT family N-acetyltransferase [Maricaulaceae bacterium]|nr:GNAT family N-acetyltransferase [Maricaulaceae bacterium]
MTRPAAICTQRLKLAPLDAALAALQLDDLPGFFTALDVAPEAAWPPDLMDRAALEWTRDRLAERPEEAGWWQWVFIWPGAAGQPDRIVGAGGFKGPPDAGGAVEIGYSMILSFREQGLATEAVNGLLGWAWRHAQVRCVQAHTLTHLTASRRVLEKAGFSETGQFEDGGETVVRYALAREQAEAA